MRVGQKTLLDNGVDLGPLHGIPIGLTGNMRFTCIPGLTAMPALSFPAGFDRQRPPVGREAV